MAGCGKRGKGLVKLLQDMCSLYFRALCLRKQASIGFSKGSLCFGHNQSACLLRNHRRVTG